MPRKLTQTSPGPGEPGGYDPPQGLSPRGTLAYWAGYHGRVGELTDITALKKALTMLRADRFRLFADVGPDQVVGIVGSQSSPNRLYSCRLTSGGGFTCCTQNLIACVVGHRSPCKHLLVLILGLVHAGRLDPETAIDWLSMAQGRPTASIADARVRDAMAETFLRHKGVQVGEVDWRPTETIPEDFYTL